MNDVDVLIAGGGISGLATAWWLAREGLAVEVWEGDTRPGGKIRSDQANGYLTERAAALVMNFRPEVDRLMMESGLDAAKTPRPTAANRYVLCNGQLVAVPMKLGSLLSSPLWTRRGKLRMLVEPLIPRGGHTDETVSEFITRRLGREMLDKAIEPYVAGPLASDPDRANAYTVLPHLTALEKRYGSLAMGVLAHRIVRRRAGCPTESFSFRGGMSTLVDRLASIPGIVLRRGRRFTELAIDRQGWRVTGSSLQGEHTLRARRVVLSVPAYVAASLVAPLDIELGRLLRGVEYAPVVVVHLGFDRSAIRHPLDGAGFLIPRREGFWVNGNLWISTLFPDRAPPGKVLLTAYMGGARSPGAVDWDDNRTVDAVLQGLTPLLGIDAAPEMVRIDRHRLALPLYHGAYHAHTKEITGRLRRLPGLHLEANYLGGVSVRDRILCGNRAAKRILSVIGSSSVVTSNSLDGQVLRLEPGT